MSQSAVRNWIRDIWIALRTQCDTVDGLEVVTVDAGDMRSSDTPRVLVELGSFGNRSQARQQRGQIITGQILLRVGGDDIDSRTALYQLALDLDNALRGYSVPVTATTGQSATIDLDTWQFSTEAYPQEGGGTTGGSSSKAMINFELEIHLRLNADGTHRTC